MADQNHPITYQFLVTVLNPHMGFVNNAGTKPYGDIQHERILRVQAIEQATWILRYGL